MSIEALVSFSARASKTNRLHANSGTAPLKVGIIGGGPGGLMTAYSLEKALSIPCEITIFEASSRLGGKIVTSHFGAAPVSYEAGAAELYDYSGVGPDPLRELIGAFDLPTSPMAGETVILGDCLLKGDEAIVREFGKKAGRELRRFTEKAKMRINPLQYYESDWRSDEDDPLSRHSFRYLLNRIPDETVRRYIEIAVHSDVATEPEQTNAKYGLQNFLMNLPEYMSLYTIDGGIERLPQELARRISAKVLLQRRVVRVERTPDELYRVSSRCDGETSSEDFDFVVVALPNNWIPLIEWGSPTLARAMRRHVKHYHCPAHYLRVSILFDQPFWRDQIAESYFMLDAFGGCCVYDESSRNGQGQYGVLGWLLAGEAALTMSNLDDDVLVQKMLDSLPACLGHGRRGFLEGKVHRWVGAVNGRPGGRSPREPESRHVPEPVDHPWLFTVGDYLFDSTLNGVLDSAQLVADWISEEVAEYHQSEGISSELDSAGVTVAETDALSVSRETDLPIDGRQNGRSSAPDQYPGFQVLEGLATRKCG